MYQNPFHGTHREGTVLRIISNYLMASRSSPLRMMVTKTLFIFLWEDDCTVRGFFGGVGDLDQETVERYRCHRINPLVMYISQRIERREGHRKFRGDPQASGLQASSLSPHDWLYEEFLAGIREESK
jgi:hypothetical protein